MTKTRDPRWQNWLCPICGYIVTSLHHNCIIVGEIVVKNGSLELVPKRCDECRWWDNWISGDKDFCDCVNDFISIYGSGGEYMFHPAADFYCKYWEKKEGGKDE